MSNIKNDINDLVSAGIITDDIAQKIEAYYSTKNTNKPNRLFTVFGVLGSILVGLGVILILAHNWDNLSKTTKTIFAFLPLLVGQLAVGFSIFKDKSETWKEASGAFLFFAVGACMALISQIYNIPGNLSSYLLTWVFLCAPLIYLLKSNILAILHIVFTTYYLSQTGYFNGSGNLPWLYFVLLAIVIPFYLQKLKTQATSNSTSLLNWLLPLSLTICLGAFITNDSALYGFLMYIALFGVLYNIGRLPVFYNLNIRKNGYLVIGSLGSVIVLLILTFRELWEELPNDNVFSETAIIAILLIAIAFALVVRSCAKNGIKSTNIFQYVFAIVALIFVFGYTTPAVPMILSNILVFALGLTAIKIGADAFHFGVLNYGLLIITALIICRFFDTDLPFEVRGLLFVLVGIGFFATNYIMLKRQKQLKK